MKDRPFARLGEALRALRERRGLSQVEAAAKAGVSRSQLCRWEGGGASGMKLENLGKVLAGYETGLEELAKELAALADPAAVIEADREFSRLVAELAALSNPTIPQPMTGERFRDLRERSGWTRREVSERTGLPLSELDSFEEGRAVRLGIRELEQLAEACCGDVEDLLPSLAPEARMGSFLRGKGVDPNG